MKERLVIILSADTSNEDLFKIIHELKFEYNYNIMTHNFGEPFQKEIYDNKMKIFVIDGSDDQEFKKIKSELDETKLCSKSENKVFILTSTMNEFKVLNSNYDCDYSINLNKDNLEMNKDNFKKIFNKIFEKSH